MLTKVYFLVALRDIHRDRAQTESDASVSRVSGAGEFAVSDLGYGARRRMSELGQEQTKTPV